MGEKKLRMKIGNWSQKQRSNYFVSSAHFTDNVHHRKKDFTN